MHSHPISSFLCSDATTPRISGVGAAMLEASVNAGGGNTSVSDAAGLSIVESVANTGDVPASDAARDASSASNATTSQAEVPSLAPVNTGVANMAPSVAVGGSGES